MDPDKDIVQRAQQGDQRAFSSLVTLYYNMVYALCLGVVRHRETARDLTQDVFLKLYTNIGQFKGQAKFKTWLYRVAVNQALDQTRKQKPAYSLDETDPEGKLTRPEVADTTRGPREHAHAGDLKQLVQQALEQLSPDHRAVLVLREFQDLSYEEIAETLNVEIGTVMSRIHYARKKIAEILHGVMDFRSRD